MNIEQIRNSSSADLLEAVKTYRRELFALKYRAAGGDTENAHKSREIRKTIARILTVLKERERQQGGSN